MVQSVGESRMPGAVSTWDRIEVAVVSVRDGVPWPVEEGPMQRRGRGRGDHGHTAVERGKDSE